MLTWLGIAKGSVTFEQVSQLLKSVWGKSEYIMTGFQWNRRTQEYVLGSFHVLSFNHKPVFTVVTDVCSLL